MNTRQLQSRFVIRLSAIMFVCLIGAGPILVEIESASAADREEKPAAGTMRDRTSGGESRRPDGDGVRVQVRHLTAAIGHLRAAGMERQAREVETALLRILLEAVEKGRTVPQGAPIAPVQGKPGGAAPSTPAQQDTFSSQVHQEGNGNWNNKIEIRWQNITHVHQAEKGRGPAKGEDAANRPGP